MKVGNVSGFLQLVGNIMLFPAIFLQATRNDGIVGQWNTGYGRRKKVYSTKNVAAAFFDNSPQAYIFCFCPINYAIKTRKSMQQYAL